MNIMRYVRPWSPGWVVLHAVALAALFALGYFADFGAS